jgi:sporulation protein YlmC with PRC-barrel domain
MRITTSAGLAALMLFATPAMAQTPNPSSPGNPSPLAVNPSSAAQPQWYTHQGEEMRASKLIGTTVKNAATESIGSINEVVLGKDGKVAAVVIGVGGFLGMGEREVAVNFGSLRIAQDENNRTVVSLNATKDGLKAAPEWKWSGDRTGTTGTGSGAARPPVAK